MMKTMMLGSSGDVEIGGREGYSAFEGFFFALFSLFFFDLFFPFALRSLGGVLWYWYVTAG